MGKANVTRAAIIAQHVQERFNLTAESFNALPRGLASELFALSTQNAALLAACKAALEWMEFTIPHLPRLSDKCPDCGKPAEVIGMNYGGPISKLRSAIALAQEGK